MPIADFICEKCELRFEHFYHREVPESLPCEDDGCDGTAPRIFSMPGEWQPRAAQSVDPTVIARGPNGEIRFLGRADAPIPEGFMRVELRNMAEKDAFEREVNRTEYARHQRMTEGRQMAFGEIQRRNRAELRTRMESMSTFGRDLARLAMDRTNNKPVGRFDAGFHIDSSHNNASNREGERSERTGWRTRK
jgi:hypothetical protein